MLGIVDVGTGDVLVERRTDVAAALALRWSDDGRNLYEGGQDGVLRFLDPQALEAATELLLTPEFTLTDVVPVPGPRLLAVSSGPGRVFFVDVRNREVVGDPLAAEATQLQAVAASPDDPGSPR